jgi:hypothetical protein
MTATPSNSSIPGRRGEAADPPRVMVPADIDTPDRIAWGLTARQLVVLALPIGTLYGLYSRLGEKLPALVWVVAAIGVVATAVVVALGRRDGLPLDAWIRHGLTLRCTPRLMTPGHPGEGSAEGTPVFVSARDIGASGVPVPAPLRSDVTRITADGGVVVEGAGRCLIACGTTSVDPNCTGTATGPVASARALTSLGITARVLDGPSVVAALAAATDPYDPPVPGPRAVPGVPITTRTPALRTTRRNP